MMDEDINKVYIDKEKQYRFQMKDEIGKTHIMSFSVGDVVRIKSFGHAYPYYVLAMKYFNITKNARNLHGNNDLLMLEYNCELKSHNFVIVGAAIHDVCDSIVYCLSNGKDYILIDGKGVEKTYFTTKKLENMKKSFKKTILHKIR